MTVHLKKILPALALSLAIFNSSYSQLTLKVEIAGLRNDKGRIMLQVFDENQKVITREIGEIRERCCSFTINNLVAGKYAVRFYHDENMNGVMETNLVGKPTEGYGFSNNVTGRFSMPPFEKWLFEMNDDKKIAINAVY